MIQFNFNGFPNQEPNNFSAKFKRPAKPRYKAFVTCLIVGLLVVALCVYVSHPPLNWHSLRAAFYLVVFGVLGTLLLIIAYNNSIIGERTYKRLVKIGSTLIIVIIIGGLIFNIISSPFFIANKYYERIDVKEVDFSEIKEVDFNKTAIIDRDSTLALGDRVMGQMPELVSQFEVSPEYTQISYKDSVYRVTPLEYADVLKYFLNRDEGIPAYITVNSTTGEAELVKLKDLVLDGMRYVPSALFNENLSRKLQLDYPTKIFGKPSFEIDEDGHPWYICTTYTHKGIEALTSVDGVVIFDPITGDSTYYDDPLEAPSWVDRIYPEKLVIEEVNNYGMYKDGFLNSIFGQKDVIVTSEGYNYLEKDGDIWIYSGLTSANSDAANLGFILVNLRTHEGLKINSAGANEISAMNSAMGHVKNYGYHATFPILVNVNSKPTYLMALKDDAGLIKMYAMVDAADYQKVEAVSMDEGLEVLKANFIGEQAILPESDNLIETSIVVDSIRFITSGGETRVYIEDYEGNRYKLAVNKGNEEVVAFLNENDVINITYIDGAIKTITKIK